MVSLISRIALKVDIQSLIMIRHFQTVLKHLIGVSINNVDYLATLNNLFPSQNELP